MASDLLIDVERGVARITINRPKDRNAMTEEMYDELADWFGSVGNRQDIHVVVLRGAGKHFVAGGDIDGWKNGLKLSAEERKKHLIAQPHRLYQMLPKLYEVPQPVLMSVRGYCIGLGVGLIGLADFVIASDTARFSIPQSRFGAPTLDGISYCLPRIVGARRAFEMVVFSEKFDAAFAKEIGLVNWVVPDDQLDEKEREIADRIAQGPALAYRLNKKLHRASPLNSYQQQLDADRQAWAECSMHDDLTEGMRAFEEKRPPRFGK